MIDLHYWPTPNGHKVTLFLEEAGVDYTIKPVNIGEGAQFEPDFLAISPNNKMPAIVDTAPADGVTSWTELDAAPPPTGNSNGTLDVELAALSSLVVHMTLGDGAGRDFRTTVALRNKV